MNIAAASIIAKVMRDKYIFDLCSNDFELQNKYALETNMGYGTKKHREALKQYGLTEYHRKSFSFKPLAL